MTNSWLRISAAPTLRTSTNRLGDDGVEKAVLKEAVPIGTGATGNPYCSGPVLGEAVLIRTVLEVAALDAAYC